MHESVHIHTQHSKGGAIPSNVGTDVGENAGLAVGARVGDSVAGTASSHVIETPAAAVLPSDVKRMNMLPDVAAWTGGMVKPLTEPFSTPVAGVPS